MILSQGVVGANDFIDSNLSEFPYLFFSSEAQRLFGPMVLDLTRFGELEDAFGSSVETQTVLVQIELNPDTPLWGDIGGNGRFVSGVAATNANVTVHAYLSYTNQISVENGLYKRD